MKFRIVATMAVVSAVLAGCASPAPDTSKGRFKVGKPYSIKGQTYYPSENYSREQTGVASWYGPGFHGKQTANGERFDQNALTAAHPTLQMPSLVRVTNLENNMSTILRVNDRGPFHGGRIIDLSKAGAEALGFRNNGTARVRVQVLGPESMALASAAKKGVDTRGAEIAMNRHGALDSRFAAYYPTLVAQPEPGIMVAASGYQPGIDGGQVLSADTLSVPQPPTLQETIVMAGGAPVAPAKPHIEQYRMAAPAPMPAPMPAPVFQMAPIISEAGAVEIHRQAASAPGIPVATLQQGDIMASGADIDSQIYVQAGSAMSRAGAMQLREKVAQLGPAQVVPVNTGDMPYFRVRIGPLESVEKADHVVNTLQRQGRQASIVVSQN